MPQLLPACRFALTVRCARGKGFPEEVGVSSVPPRLLFRECTLTLQGLRPGWQAELSVGGALAVQRPAGISLARGLPPSSR